MGGATAEASHARRGVGLSKKEESQDFAGQGVGEGGDEAMCVLIGMGFSRQQVCLLSMRFS